MTENGDLSGQAVQGDTTLCLRILATSDLHACLTSWDYFAQKSMPNRGLSRVATLIAAARAQVENCVLVDNGDFLAGSGLGDYMVAQGGDAPHPMILAMNQLGYDAVNLGNHEFSHGLGFLSAALQQASFDVVASNFTIAGLAHVRRTLLMQRQMRDDSGAVHTVKIGVLGVMPSQTLMWEAANLQGKASAQPMLDSARSHAQKLRDQGADIVIALAHTGVQTGTPNGANAEASEEAMAQNIANLPGIDAVIAGHSHKVFPTGADVFSARNIVLPGFFGSHLGVIDLQLRRSAGVWQAKAVSAQVWPVARRDVASGVLHAVARDDAVTAGFADAAHTKILDDLQTVIGTAPHRLHTYFSLLRSCAALGLIAAVQADALKAALAGGPHAGLPLLSAVAPFKAGGRGGAENYTDFPAGPMRKRHVADLYPHPNTLVGFRVTGAEVTLWLERAVSMFARILPHSTDAELIDADFPSFNFDVMFGVTYSVDLTQPAQFDARGTQIHPFARRITNLQYNGKDVQPDQHFVIASNSYRRDTCIGFFATSALNLIYQNETPIQNLLREYVAQQKPFPGADAAHWRFAPITGASAVLRSCPNAVQVLNDIADFKPAPLGLDDAGFQRFRLHL